MKTEEKSQAPDLELTDPVVAKVAAYVEGVTGGLETAMKVLKDARGAQGEPLDVAVVGFYGVKLAARLLMVLVPAAKLAVNAELVANDLCLYVAGWEPEGAVLAEAAAEMRRVLEGIGGDGRVQG